MSSSKPTKLKREKTSFTLIFNTTLMAKPL